MKYKLIACALAGLILAAPNTVHRLAQAQDPQPTQKDEKLWRCVIVVIIVYGGYKIVTKIVIPLCERYVSNRHWMETNMALGLYAANGGPATIQSTTNLGSVWSDGYQFSAVQTGPATARVTVFLNGTELEYIDATAGTNDVVTVDFSHLPPVSTNETGLLRLRQ